MSPNNSIITIYDIHNTDFIHEPTHDDIDNITCILNEPTTIKKQINTIKYLADKRFNCNHKTSLYLTILYFSYLLRLYNEHYKKNIYSALNYPGIVDRSMIIYMTEYNLSKSVAGLGEYYKKYREYLLPIMNSYVEEIIKVIKKD
jgi:hypothetical protein